MARPHRSLNTARVTTRSENLLKLSSKVLKLCLQSLNLPIMGSKAQLLTWLKRASTGNPVNPNKDMVGLNALVLWRTKHLRNSRPLQLVESTPYKASVSAFRGTTPSPSVPRCLLLRTCCSQMQRKISSIPISPPIKGTPSVQRSVLPSRTSYPSLCRVLCKLFVQNSTFSPTPSSQLSQLRVWPLLWVFRGQWTIIWRTKYSAKTASFLDDVL